MGPWEPWNKTFDMDPLHTPMLSSFSSVCRWKLAGDSDCVFLQREHKYRILSRHVTRPVFVILVIVYNRKRLNLLATYTTIRRRLIPHGPLTSRCACFFFPPLAKKTWKKIPSGTESLWKVRNKSLPEIYSPPPPWKMD